MLKYANYDIVFQEFPDEVTLAINFSNCPNGCPGCHSAYLSEDIGEPLTIESLDELIKKSDGITCVGLMGGDIDPVDINNIAKCIKTIYGGKLKVGWYSGKDTISTLVDFNNFDYIKVGSYKEKFGGLSSPTTNQRFYAVIDGKLSNITNLFLK